MHRNAVILLVVVIVQNSVFAAPADESKFAEVDSETLFVRRIGPLLREKCLGCHGETPSRFEGAIDVRSRESLFAGGDSGTHAIVPGNLIRGVDQPIAALISDLKQRGLLESTLIVWCGEFGRTPDNGVRGGTAYGRDHNPGAMTILLAGGGCNAGHTVGATDETGMTAVEDVHHVRDFHVTLLRLLGLDDHKLNYYHAGRFKQLSQFGGNVIEKLIA